MVQTQSGASENPWIAYLRACAARYKAGEPSESLVERPPCKCESQPVPKRKARQVTSESQQKQEVDNAIQTERTKSKKITKQSEKGLQKTRRHHKDKLREGKQAEGSRKGTIDEYAHATTRALERVRRERAEGRQ